MHHHRVCSRGEKPDHVWVVTVTILGEVQLAGMQIGTKEAVEPQRFLSHPLFVFEAVQKTENSTAEEIRVSSMRA
jgi:hypothetical protein